MCSGSLTDFIVDRPAILCYAVPAHGFIMAPKNVSRQRPLMTRLAYYPMTLRNTNEWKLKIKYPIKIISWYDWGNNRRLSSQKCFLSSANRQTIWRDLAVAVSVVGRGRSRVRLRLQSGNCFRFQISVCSASMLEANCWSFNRFYSVENRKQREPETGILVPFLTKLASAILEVFLTQWWRKSRARCNSTDDVTGYERRISGWLVK